MTQANISPQGRLRIGLPQLGKYLLPQLVEFQQEFPSIELELSFSDRLVNVIDEGFDAVIRIGEIGDSRLTMRRLTGYRHRLVAAPAYLAQHGTPTRPADLASHACLRYRYPTSGRLEPWPLLVKGRPVSVDLPQSAIADVTQALQAMAEAGLGIAFLPDFTVADAISTGQLIVVLEKHIDDHQDVSILWPSGRQSLPKIKVFVDFMVSRLGGA
ncbi:LysR substrate-binding domain-containing protein [Paenalcaligenes niemegkensis]|uniref:LysR substrate-binding domain-containing protein n=1 Tax=Paenalcaligenes niemegkensis TaxID=2895469 RepID=UPI001EE83722|nr:LysR substrate-binding domain-containing protein [Paenalcaligenes niemegkensis]MCQ9616103.1 LysR substrate-binding domain-containing protein [Paenalcaligenes niemegkensis]